MLRMNIKKCNIAAKSNRLSTSRKPPEISEAYVIWSEGEGLFHKYESVAVISLSE